MAWLSLKNVAAQVCLVGLLITRISAQNPAAARNLATIQAVYNQTVRLFAHHHHPQT